MIQANFYLLSIIKHWVVRTISSLSNGWRQLQNATQEDNFSLDLTCWLSVAGTGDLGVPTKHHHVSPHGNAGSTRPG